MSCLIQRLVFATLRITLFFSMARHSSFLPTSLPKFDHTKIVTLRDILVAYYGFDLKKIGAKLIGVLAEVL